MSSTNNVTELSRLLTKSEYQVADWLLGFCLYKAGDPLLLSDEPSYLIQLKDLFFSIPFDEQIKFKSAVVYALEEWHPDSHGLRVFTDLALLASYTRTIESLDTLRLVMEYLIDSFTSEQHQDTLRILFGIIAGFSPDKAVSAFLERFYYSASINYSYVAQIFLGLCLCNPRNFPSYIPRLLNVLSKHSAFFRADYIFAEFVRVVGLATVASNYYAIRREYKNFFLDFLCYKEWSPAEVVLIESEGMYLKVKDSYTALGPEYRGDAQLHKLVFFQKLSKQHLSVVEYRNIIRAKALSFNHDPVKHIKARI